MTATLQSTRLRRCSRHPLVPSALVVFAVTVYCGIVMRDFGLSTDEAIYIKNNAHLADWFADFRDVGLGQNFSKEQLQEGWHYARDDSKNLPLVTIVSSLSHLLTGGFEQTVPSYRWGNVLVFAITCGVAFHWLRSLLSTAAAVVAVAALVGIPRLLANSCLISIDPLVGCFWLLASWALTRARNNWKWSVGFAVLAGIGATAKTTFWFAFPVWVVWGLLHRPKEFKRAAIGVATVTPLTFLLFVPTWWADPAGGIRDYIQLLRADGEKGWPIDAYYLGEVYQYSDSDLQLPPLPWHAVGVLSLVTTPVWISLLALIGVFAWWRQRREAGGAGSKPPAAAEAVTLWLMSAAILPVIVMLPTTPAHDGVRLFRASFFFVALLAGFGFDGLAARWLRNDESRSGFRSRRELSVVVVICALSMVTVWQVRPATLSYYNLLVGGFSGGTERVRLSDNSPVRDRPLFEISYWWELFDNPSLAQMQTNLPANARLWVFPENLGFSFEQYRRWGLLRKDIETCGPDRAEFVLIYGRLGRITLPHMYPLGNKFFDGQPVWERRVGGVRVVALYRWP